MILSVFLAFSIYTAVSVCNELMILSKTQTSILEKYQSYSDVQIIHLNIPQDTLFASFRFVAEETEMSVIKFGCKPRKISLYMKQGALPVINPDGSPFPKLFKNISRNELYGLEFTSDKNPAYINITSPDPGSYYIATFLSYSDPKYNQITQQGLAPSCYATVESTLYGQKIENPVIISEGDLTQTVLITGQSRYFKFYIPLSLDRAIISIHNIFFFSQDDNLLIRTGSMKPSSENYFNTQDIIYSNTSSGTVRFWTKPEEWHYLEFKMRNNIIKETSSSNFTFKLRYFTNVLPQEHTNYQYLENKTLYNYSCSKSFHNNKITDLVPYKQYNLVREASSESFIFSYELEEELNSNVAIPINMTNQHFSVFKFKVREGTDVGGTLQFILAFKSKLKKYGSSISLEDEPANHTIIACLRKGIIDIPTWPNLCVSNGLETPAPLILNKTVDNSTVLIPYPESGTWYATLKLFCGVCKPCNCPQNCQFRYEQCLNECEANCMISGSCQQCTMNCSERIISDRSCEGCNCDGPCLKNIKSVCNTSVIFDIGSHPCIFGHCSKNGKCVFMVSDGVAFSTCICVNKYRGWDCSDNSQATPYYMVVTELLLLVLSNLFFLPAVYVAFKRRYYIESLTYFAMCVFSTFYHACDAGENIISFCIVRWESLQFGDFFCALLSIWVTLIAMADLPQLSSSISHMGGSIILAFCTTINKRALWIFALPFITGLIIIAVSWYFKYRKVKQRFGNKRYLFVSVPIAVILVGIGLVLYAFLQTENNYKYLHTMWHILMAIALVIVLPKANTFMPEVLL